MLQGVPNLLAETEIPIKLIVGAIFFVFWVISQIVTAVTKKKDEHIPAGKPMGRPPTVPQQSQQPNPPRRRTNVPAQMQQPAPMPRKAAGPAQTQQQQTITARQQRKLEQSRQKGPPPLKKSPQPTKPVVQPQPAEVILESVASVARPKPIVATKKKASTDGPTKNERLQAILRPANLRKDYILTELLRPPLSMRDE